MANRVYRMGDVEITALVDAVPAPVSVDWPFPDVPLAAWEGSADGSLDENGLFQPNLGCFLVRDKARTILVDCGIGPGPNAYLKKICGSLPDRLAEAGTSFADIDAVIFTHLHMDHVGWASLAGADALSRPTMPDVPHYVPADELAFWIAEPTIVGGHHRQAFDAYVRPLVRDGLVEAVPGDRPFMRGFSFLPLPGHTPGHSGVLIDGGAETAIIVGDALHCPAQVASPERCHRADLDRDRATTSRRRLLERASADRWLVAGGHLRDDVVFGRIAATGRGFRHVPAFTD